jgi:gamma-glutamyl-gamma-aminobutyrate hydrolase PuuD
MTGKQCAIMERNINKSVDEIKKLLAEGGQNGEVNNFYVETITEKLDNIQAELNKMEY